MELKELISPTRFFAIHYFLSEFDYKIQESRDETVI